MSDDGMGVRDSGEFGFGYRGGIGGPPFDLRGCCSDLFKYKHDYSLYVVGSCCPLGSCLICCFLYCNQESYFCCVHFLVQVVGVGAEEGLQTFSTTPEDAAIQPMRNCLFCLAAN